MGDQDSGATITESLLPTDSWFEVAAGKDAFCALRGAGELYCWGANNGMAKLGRLDQSADQYAPMRVGTGEDWASVTLGDHHGCAIKTDGSLWCWGSNASGQLGFNSNLNLETTGFVPTQEDSASTWLEVKAGAQHTCAIRDTGELFCWGNNELGQLGLGDFTNRFSPTLVHEGPFKDLAPLKDGTCAVHGDDLDSDGIYCWGQNEAGQLATGDFVPYNVPVLVDGFSLWRELHAASSESVISALRADGTIWSWGLPQSFRGGHGVFWDPSPQAPAFPVLRVTGAPTALVRDPNVDVSFACDNPECQVLCQLDNDAEQTCTSPLQLLGLESGDHTLRLRPVDAQGQPLGDSVAVTWTTEEDLNLRWVQTPAKDEEGWISANELVFEWATDDVSAVFECREGDLLMPCEELQNLTSYQIDYSPKVVSVRARNAAALEWEETISFSWKQDGLSLVSCKSLGAAGGLPSGIYEVVLPPTTPSTDKTEVYCDMETDGGGWTLVADWDSATGNFDGTAYAGYSTPANWVLRGIL